MSIGVLKKINNSQLVAPTFLLPTNKEWRTKNNTFRHAKNVRFIMIIRMCLIQHVTRFHYYYHITSYTFSQQYDMALGDVFCIIAQICTRRKSMNCFTNFYELEL